MLSLLTACSSTKQQMRFEIFWSREPVGLHFAWRRGVVVGEKDAQQGVDGVQIGGLSQAKLAGEAILEHASEAFDAAFGLGAAGGDEGDAELLQGAPELETFHLTDVERE
jgi:hypothetical protein